MKFPGKRKSKHYFPVNARDPLLQQFQPENETSAAWVVGIDQTLVDIEAKVDDEFIERYGLSAGHSLVIEDDVAEALYQELKQKNLITHQFAGGTIGNTMHNYSVLADDRSVLLGVMCSNIEIGSYAYRYLCNTSSRTDLNYLQGVDGPIGRCFTLIGELNQEQFRWYDDELEATLRKCVHALKTINTEKSNQALKQLEDLNNDNVKYALEIWEAK